MKTRVNRQELVEALGAVAAVAATRTPKPILQCVLVEAHADHCVLKATDLELSVRYTISQVEVEKEGRVLVSADKLSQIVRESGDEVLDIEVDEGACHVRGQDSHFQIYVQSAEEFPPVPEMTGEPDFEVETAVLRRLTEWTVFAAARENSRYAINGVLWEKEKNKLVLVATDGRRLSKAVGEAQGAKDGPVRAIVPGKAMMLFLRVLGEEDPTARVKLTGNQVVLQARRATVSSALVEGQFPRYQDVIPVDNDKKAELSTAEFLSAVRRAALLTNEESKAVRLSFVKDELTFSSRSPDQGEAVIKMLVAYQGPSIEIGFNPVFLADVLKVVETDRVVFEMTEANRPGLVRCGSDFLYVIMPLNLS